MEKLQTIWKLSRQYGNFPDNLKIFPTFWKLFRQFGNLPENLEAFGLLYFPDSTKTFQTKPKLSRQLRNIQENLETFQTIKKLLRNLLLSSRQVPDIKCKNFPDTQKNSREQCSRAPYIFLSLLWKSLWGSRVNVVPWEITRPKTLGPTVPRVFAHRMYQ